MTKHKEDCKMAFGRKDLTCQRCVELLNGAKPVVWANTRKANARIDRLALDAHFAAGGPHATGKCGPVCTFGDW